LEWGRGMLGLFLATIVAGVGSYGTSKALESAIASNNFWLLFINLSVSSTVAFIIFSLVAMQLKLPESDMLLGKIRQKLRK
jgi:putative peptidoglycan lipid II flippase